MRVCACVRVCVRVCVRARVRARVRCCIVAFLFLSLFLPSLCADLCACVYNHTQVDTHTHHKQVSFLCVLLTRLPHEEWYPCVGSTQGQSLKKLHRAYTERHNRGSTHIHTHREREREREREETRSETDRQAGRQTEIDRDTVERKPHTHT